MPWIGWWIGLESEDYKKAGWNLLMEVGFNFLDLLEQTTMVFTERVRRKTPQDKQDVLAGVSLPFKPKEPFRLVRWPLGWGYELVLGGQVALSLVFR